MNFNSSYYIPSIRRIINTHSELRRAKRGLPNPGMRPEGKSFSAWLNRIDDAFIKGNEVYSKEWVLPIECKPFNTGAGSPFKENAFYPAVREANEALNNQAISQYPFASGDRECRCRVAQYLAREGFKTDIPGQVINEKNIIFFNSTTEAFSLLMKVICRPGDVILFTEPTYGLLAYAPERCGAFSRGIPLREEDQWMINPSLLKDTIISINDELKKQNFNCGYDPCVTAFVNINPNNPTGLVMGEKERDLLSKINKVCKENGVFIVDDIIYRDLCYDYDNQALPIATINDAFSNTITLFGTSKSYGLAGARAGAIVADEIIIRGLRNEIFQLMDSTSIIVSHLIAGAFNVSEERDSYYKNYFPQVIKAYKRNWIVLKTIVEGEQSCFPLERREYKLIKEIFSDKTKQILKTGIPGLSTVKGICPESGFFALLDFTKLLGAKEKATGLVLNSEIDILLYFYRVSNIKLLMGASFAWPNSNEAVARVTYAYEKKDLIQMLYQLFLGINELEIDL